MRKILFRGKRIDDGEWVEGYVFNDGFVDSKRMFVGGLVIMDYKGTADDRWDVGTAFYEVIPSTICQYTGLTDKNGNKIWENDIVICKKEINGNFIDEHIEMGFVEMRHGAYGLHRKQGYYRPFKDWLEDYEYEVIGNVFDNAELIN